jgi:hypothetical protein
VSISLEDPQSELNVVAAGQADATAELSSQDWEIVPDNALDPKLEADSVQESAVLPLAVEDSAPQAETPESKPKARASESTLKVREDKPSDPRGPIESRVLRQEQEEELRERNRLWAEMRAREKQKQMAQQMKEIEDRQRRHNSIDFGLWLKRALVVGVALAILAGVGFGGYAIYDAVANSDYKLTADEAWEEYAKDTKAADQKYKGKFIQLKGKVQQVPGGAANKFMFELHSGATWRIEFILKKDESKDLEAGKEITIRCRFTKRKEPDGNLNLSSISLLK